MMNAPFLESSEKLDRFYPASFHKIKFHIFQNIPKYFIHILRPFKYNDMCELCDTIMDKDKKGRIMVKKSFDLYKGVIDVFIEFYILTMEKISFHLAHVRISGSMECGRTRSNFSALMH